MSLLFFRVSREILVFQFLLLFFPVITLRALVGERKRVQSLKSLTSASEAFSLASPACSSTRGRRNAKTQHTYKTPALKKLE